MGRDCLVRDQGRETSVKTCLFMKKEEVAKGPDAVLGPVLLGEGQFRPSNVP